MTNEAITSINNIPNPQYISSMWKKFRRITKNIPTVINIPNFIEYVFTISVFSFLSMKRVKEYAIKERKDDIKIKNPNVKTDIFNMS